VRVQIALEISAFDKVRQAVLSRRVDLAAVLTQLGRDIREPDGLEHRLLGVACNATLTAKDTVLVDLEPAFLPQPPHREVVLPSIP